MAHSSPSIGQICFLLTYTFTVVNTLAITQPPLSLSNAFANSPTVNVTALDLTIDPRFGFTAEYGETTLPATPCLMSIVDLVAQYAELDWQSKVGQRHGVVLPEYPQVEIAVLPAASASSVEVRLIIWGFWIGIRDMVRINKFPEAEFEILWEREVVAYIYITKPMDLQTTSNNGTLGADKPLTLLPGSNTTIGGILDTANTTEYSPDALSDGDFSWEPIFSPLAKTLTVFEVFLTVMAGLKNAAAPAASDKVPRAYASAATGVDANVQFYIHKRSTPRPRPPYFQYIHVIKALRLVPQYMLQRKMFAEMIFVIKVDGIPVGEGFLEKGHYIPPRFGLGDIFGPKDNVTLS